MKQPSHFHTTVFTFLLIAILTLVPRTAAAQYGVFMGSADLDGNGTAENVYNNGSTINVVSGGSVTPYNIGFTSWALLYGNFTSVVDLDGQPGAEISVNRGGTLYIITHRTRSTYSYTMTGSWAAAPGGIVDQDGQPGAEIAIVAANSLRIVKDRQRSVREVFISGQFAVIGNAIADLDGIAGAEVPIANGPYLRIYQDRTGGTIDLYISPGSWAVCTTGSNCVSDMNGDPGKELVIAVPNEIRIVKLYTTGGGFANYVSNYWIGGQYAILSDGVRDFDGAIGNDIAMSRSDGNLLILRPRGGSLQTINGYSTFGTTWTLVNYADLDGAAGDEIRLQSNTNGRIYRIYPRTGSVSAE
jgi:hypothetical protein